MAQTLFGVAQKLANRLFPQRNSPSGLRFTFPFATNNITSFEYQLQLQDRGLEWITGVFIDNSNNASIFTLEILETGQKYLIPGNSQGSLTLLGIHGADKVSLRGATVGNVDVPIVLQNFEGTDIVWNTLDPGTVVGVVTVQGTVTANPPTGVWTAAGSPIIAAGGTAQILFAANALRKGLVIYNGATQADQDIGVAPEALFINFGANAQLNCAGNSIEILPGGYYTFPQGMVSTQSVSIIGVTTGHRFSAWQF